MMMIAEIGPNAFFKWDRPSAGDLNVLFTKSMPRIQWKRLKVKKAGKSISTDK